MSSTMAQVNNTLLCIQKYNFQECFLDLNGLNFLLPDFLRLLDVIYHCSTYFSLSLETCGNAKERR